METLSATHPSSMPTQTSHVRESHLRPTAGLPQQATRTSSGITQPPATSNKQWHSSQQDSTAPGSQGSAVSIGSNGSSIGPRLETSSSNVSQLTNYTDLASPTSNVPSKTLEVDANGKQNDNARVRMRTPEGNRQRATSDAVQASPMSVASPATVNGTKRTANGLVKAAPSVPSTPLVSTHVGSRSRGESMSSTSSRAGELAANLKTRLGYAMAKVQNGWEHKNIEEVEILAAQKMSPSGRNPQHFDHGKRPTSSGLSNGTARLSMYGTYGQSSVDDALSPPSKRHSGTYTTFSAPSQRAAAAFVPGPPLQPSADLRPTTSRTYHPSHHRHLSSNTVTMSPPRTPVSTHPRRPPTIRTDTQTAEAERDALQALYQLGSPHASQISRQQNASQASSSQASPLRTEFATPRRVTFARSESDNNSARLSSSEPSP